MRIAFIGTGRMGAAMVRNLVAAGHRVTAYNRTREKAEGLGADVADAVEAASRGADVTITMLPDDPAVESVVGEISTPHICTSTISTALARCLGVRDDYLSAPVFGRPEAAEARKLLVVAA